MTRESKTKGAIIAAVLMVVATGIGIWIYSRSKKSDPAETLETQALDESVSLPDREKAALELGNGGPRNIPHVRQIVSQSTVPEVKAAAIMSLWQLRDWESMPVLLDLLDHPDELVRRRAAMVVSKMLGFEFKYRSTDPPADRAKAVVQMRRRYAMVGNDKPFPDR